MIIRGVIGLGWVGSLGKMVGNIGGFIVFYYDTIPDFIEKVSYRIVEHFSITCAV